LFAKIGILTLQLLELLKCHNSSLAALSNWAG
jgi:hypothetical protein